MALKSSQVAAREKAQQHSKMATTTGFLFLHDFNLLCSLLAFGFRTKDAGRSLPSTKDDDLAKLCNKCKLHKLHKMHKMHQPTDTLTHIGNKAESESGRKATQPGGPDRGTTTLPQLPQPKDGKD